jgi:hypothetical protein
MKVAGDPEALVVDGLERPPPLAEDSQSSRRDAQQDGEDRVDGHMAGIGGKRDAGSGADRSHRDDCPPCPAGAEVARLSPQDGAKLDTRARDSASHWKSDTVAVHGSFEGKRGCRIAPVLRRKFHREALRILSR